MSLRSQALSPFPPLSSGGTLETREEKEREPGNEVAAESVAWRLLAGHLSKVNPNATWPTKVVAMRCQANRSSECIQRMTSLRGVTPG